MNGLDCYTTLGNSGLIVSPLSLGTMTFGTQRWGADKSQSADIFKLYYEKGGNFIDTADVYSAGASETIVGQLVQDMKIRDEVVIATKAGFGTGKHPHSGGNGRKRIYQALHTSMERLNTDYIDLFWVHMWDMVTPVEEVLQTISSLITAGKIRYWGLSNVPAWYAAKVIEKARAANIPLPISLQLEYSLVERSIEAEHVPLSQVDGLAIQPWSPLAGGFLTGKYSESDPRNRAGQRGSSLPDGAEDTSEEKNRLSGDNPFGDSKFTQKNWSILSVVKNIAEETGYQPAQIGLHWLLQQKHVVAPLIGVSKLEQLNGNIDSLSIQLTDEHMFELNKVSQPSFAYPTALFNEHVQKFVFGGHNIKAW